MLTFSKSEVDRIQHTNLALRWGQNFHQKMKLDRVTGPDKNWCDKLYAASDNIAKAMVRQRTDMTQ